MPAGQITGRPRLPYAEPKSFFGGRPPATLPGAVKPDPVPRRTRGSPGLTSWALLAPDEHCPPRRGCDQDSQARFRPLGCQGSGRQLHLLEPPTRRVLSPLSLHSHHPPLNVTSCDGSFLSTWLGHHAQTPGQTGPSAAP